MPELKRNIKDSVFTALFGDPENAVQLYRSLHPEDTQTAAADCKIIALDTMGVLLFRLEAISSPAQWP